MTRTTLHVRGMHCASCVNHVERNLKKVPGVREALVNLATEEASVTHDAAQAPAARLVEAVKDAGYDAAIGESESEDDASGSARQRPPPGGRGLSLTVLSAPTAVAAETPRQATISPHHSAEPQHAHDHAAPSAESPARLPWPWVVSAILAMPVVVLGMTWMSATSAWIQFALAAPVQLLLGWPFYRGAFKAARHYRADMDTLVALGTSVAFIYSAVVTIRGGDMVYFDTAVVILVLIGLGKWLELRARGSAAAAIRGLMHLQPHEATIVTNNTERVVPIETVRPGDVLLVRPGQRVPVDGRVIEGRSAIDQSMVTGESMPAEVGPGDTVIGGTLNQAGAFRFEATRTGKGMLLAQVVDMVKRAQASKASIQRIADRVAGVFVPVVLLIALGTLLGWGLLGSGAANERWIHAMVNTVAVLIVACPCALGLATPTAIMVGTGIGARRGILIKDAAALERAGKLTHVVLDKTGTLTEGRAVVTDLESSPASGGGRGQGEGLPLLALAAAVESPSEHPLGRAIVSAAREAKLAIPSVQDFRSVTGGGVSGRVNGQLVSVEKPSEAHAAALPSIATLRAAGKTVVVVTIDARSAGVIALADAIKPNAAEAVARLHRLGLRVTLMTGDNEATARAVASQLGIDDVIANALPGTKHDLVTALRQRGQVVAMVGDGINDAPALAAADVGIAMGGGTEIAANAGHVVLVGGDLAALPRAVALSRATMRRIHVGLFWAFAYNVVLIPIAVAGLLHPMLAAAAMAMSSVSVVMNALWLKRAKW